ncbi:unnamed protein product [Phytophthora fragariaefolia]|uniref:Unnamed protein product n=1 Tax=Phytophthora fragariaefolia TaxID=1490495 RepID=A0A9W6Y890_9STRA|nr:unnamed protein product [Phytophthora fragariaefolia]
MQPQSVVLLVALNVLTCLEAASFKGTTHFTSPACLKKLWGWAETKKPPEAVFTRLKLDRTGTQLFDHVDFNLWVSYTRAVVQSDPEAAIFKMIAPRYSDDVLSGMILAAKKSSATENIATKLEFEQMRSWRAAGKNIDDMFQVFKLDKAGDDLLANPLLSSWINYMKFSNKEAPQTKTTLIEMLTKYYGDGGISKIIETARKAPATQNIAKRLEAEQVQLWLKTNRLPEDVFTLLSLDRAGDELLATPQFKTWTKYINYYNKENPDAKTTILAQLGNHFDEDELTRILIAAMKAPSTEATAAKLQDERFKIWLTREDPVSPGTVFRLLQLDKAGDDLLINLQFTNWLKYADEFNVKYIDAKQFPIKILRAYYRDDARLANIILAAKKNPFLQGISRSLEDELLKGWAASRMQPSDVLKSLKLDKEGDKIFESPLWSYFTQYLERYNKGYPRKQETMITALSRSYDDNELAALLIAAKKSPKTKALATKLENDQVSAWLKDAELPGALFGYLALDKSLDNLLANPVLNVWSKYLDAFNLKFPSKRVSMIDTFRSNFGDEALSQMLIAAKQTPSAENVATTLQASLLNKWLLEKKIPADVSKVIGGMAANEANAKLLSTYSKKFKEISRVIDGRDAERPTNPMVIVLERPANPMVIVLERRGKRGRDDDTLEETKALDTDLSEDKHASLASSPRDSSETASGCPSDARTSSTLWPSDLKVLVKTSAYARSPTAPACLMDNPSRHRSAEVETVALLAPMPPRLDLSERTQRLAGVSASWPAGSEGGVL